MAQRPTNPSPYMTRVDATKDISFQFLVAEADIFTEVHIKIRNNKLADDETTFKLVAQLDLINGRLTYSTDGGATNIEVGTSYPTKYKGNDGINSIVMVDLPANILSNGNEYKWQIDGIGDTREFYFETAITPSAEITSSDIIAEDGVDKLYTVRTIFDGALKSGESYADYDYYRWEIYRLIDGGEALEQSSGDCYGANMEYEYGRFLGGETYIVRLFIKPTMWQNEVEVSKTILVDYTFSRSVVAPVSAVDPSRNRIFLDFSHLIQIAGIPSDELGYELDEYTGVVALDEGQTIMWDSADANPLSIPDGSCIVTKFKLNNSHSGDIITAEFENDIFRFGYNGGFYWNCVTKATTDDAPTISIPISDYGNDVAMDEAWWLLCFKYNNTIENKGTLMLWRVGYGE